MAETDRLSAEAGRWESRPHSVHLRGQRAVLVGLGVRTHVALARYLVRKGAEVTITDAKNDGELKPEIELLADLPVKLSLGGHRLEELLPADVAFVSPGVPREIPLLSELATRGVRISSEIELLFELCPAPIVGITGSSGKTTTTTLAGEMLAAGGRRTFVGGNIGTPLIERVDELSPEDRVVLELSSFQLECLHRSPHIGAILNITPNHLDRHHTFERYAEAKRHIIEYQTGDDWAVLGLDDPTAASMAAFCRGRLLGFSQDAELEAGTFRQGEHLVWRYGGEMESICSVRDLLLRGRHNVYNVLAAAAIAKADGVPTARVAAVAAGFRGVEHRLELVTEIAGVKYVNDSIATSPERALAALRSYTEPIVLIAGGRSKHLPLEALACEIGQRVRALVTIGEMAEELEAAVRAQSGRIPTIRRAKSLDEAVEIAAALAETGDVVLLSPAGTSFDQFRDFEERGRAYKAAIEALRRRTVSG